MVEAFPFISKAQQCLGMVDGLQDGNGWKREAVGVTLRNGEVTFVCDRGDAEVVNRGGGDTCAESESTRVSVTPPLTK